MAYVKLEDVLNIIRNENHNLAGLINHIEEHCPTADVVEVEHGEWIKKGNEKRCSVCGFIYYSNNDEWNFCPNCGAKMYKKR